MTRPAPRSTLFPYTTLFRSLESGRYRECGRLRQPFQKRGDARADVGRRAGTALGRRGPTMGSTRLVQRLPATERSEEHTSELQSRGQLVCRLLLEKKK